MDDFEWASLFYETSNEFVGPPKPAMDFTALEDHVMTLLLENIGQLKTMRSAYRRMILEGMAMIVLGAAPARDQFSLEDRIIGMNPTLIGIDDFYKLVTAEYKRPEPTWPRAPRAFPNRGQQAPRQSFRRTMRSVNRNR